MLTAILLAATIDTQAICAKYKGYQPPAAATTALKECGGESGCYVDLGVAFANGDEVTQDFDVAEYFLCEAPIAEAELEGMLEHIANMRSGEESEKLDFCQYATSGYGSMICASRRNDETIPQLDAKLDELRKQSKVKKQYDALRKFGEAYASTEAERIGEQSRGGTGYAAISIGEETAQKEQLVTAIERWTGERAPAASEADLKRADGELNAAYRAEIKRIVDSGEESIQFWNVNLRNAQRAWIKYRDAFADYYAARWKGTAPADALRREIVTQLTRDRTAELRID